MEAQKHYFGVLTDGELVARGIELRRHDTPRFIMEFQRSLILALFSGESCEQVRIEGYAKARELISESIRRIMEGEVSARDLAASKVLRRPLPTYTRAIAHVSAAIRVWV
jgi:DNA polymerase elongation subunit (family B)